jgi:hypothetical protein
VPEFNFYEENIFKIRFRNAGYISFFFLVFILKPNFQSLPGSKKVGHCCFLATLSRHEFSIFMGISNVLNM